MNPLNINVRLKGWVGMKWKITIKIDDTTAYTKNGVFDNKGFVTFTATKIIKL
jgi:hypothetical protein